MKIYFFISKQHIVVPILLLGFLFTSCNKMGPISNPSKIFAPDSINASNVTYTNFISIILKQNCSTCHAAEGSAAAWWVNTNDYTNCVDNYNKIALTLLNKTMPPPPKFPFSERDRNLISAWIERGLPK